MVAYAIGQGPLASLPAFISGGEGEIHFGGRGFKKSVKIHQRAAEHSGSGKLNVIDRIVDVVADDH